MSGASKSRSKSANSIKRNDENANESQNDNNKDEGITSNSMVDALVTTPIVLRRYKMPYHNFLRDVKLQMLEEHLSNQEVVKIASQRWKTMTFAEKEPYIQEAAYAKVIDAQNQKTTAKQQPVKRKRKCPKCGGYPASTSPSETETGTVASESESDENENDYSSDTYYSCSTQTVSTTLKNNGSPEHDAAKKSKRQKRRTKKSRKHVKRRKEETSSSGSASYYANSSDNSLSSDTAIHSDGTNYTSASI